MNILLIKPLWPYPRGEDLIYNRIWPPLCLLNCAALLEREGHKVKILDAHAERIAARGVKEFIGGYDKVFITSSTLDRWQCPNLDIEPFLHTVQEIRQVMSEVYIMGYHGTINPLRILQITGAKAAIRNEPELATLEICRGRALQDIRGISFVNNKKLISNPDRKPLEIGEWGMPSFHLLDFRKYQYEILGDNFALFEGSRGCPHNCNFCSKIMYGSVFRQKAPEVLLGEVDEVVRKHGVKTGYFIDLDFIVNRQWVERVCDLLIQRNYNFRWCCQTRADKTEVFLLGKMKEAGCELIHFGIETSSERIMNAVNKEMTLEKAERGVRLAQEAGMETLCIFIFGLVSETEEERRKTIALAYYLNSTYVFYHIYVPYHDPDFFINGTKLFTESLVKLVQSSMLKFYLRPRYLLGAIKRRKFSMLFKQLILFLGYLK